MNSNKYLHEIFLNPKRASSFSGKYNLRKQILTDKKSVSRKNLSDFLAKQRTYSLHKPRRIRYPRSKIYTYGIDEFWESDLAEFPQLAPHNDGNRYLLVVIDTFSKFVWVRPLKRKSAQEVSDGFKSIILSSKRVPKLLRTDNDRAYLSALFSQLVKKYKIRFYTTLDDSTKAAYVERIIRTLKMRISRYLTANRTYKFINVIQQLVDNYNKTTHRTIGMKPIEVKTSDEKRLFKRMFPIPTKIIPRKFSVNDKVRISFKPKVFGKEGTQKWSEEIFIIDRLKGKHQPWRYTLKEWDGSPISGSFYEPELQKVDETSFLVEKQIRNRTRKGEKQVLVKWLGYSNKYNSWIPKDSLTDIR